MYRIYINVILRIKRLFQKCLNAQLKAYRLRHMPKRSKQKNQCMDESTSREVSRKQFIHMAMCDL